MTTALLAATATALAACGDAGVSTTGARATVTAPAPIRAAGSATVTIRGFAYRPETITVRRGTRVTWVDRDAANHTVTFDHGRDLGNVDKGQHKSVVFRKRGSLSYICQYHPFMKGRVIVR